MNKRMTKIAMIRSLEVGDQTLGCANCERAWWDEYDTENPEDFHHPECPLLGQKLKEATGDYYEACPTCSGSGYAHPEILDDETLCAGCSGGGRFPKIKNAR